MAEPAQTLVAPPQEAQARPSGHLAADAGVLLVAVVWGSSYSVMQVLTDAGMGVPLFLTIRFAVALLPLLAMSGRKLSRITRAETAFGVTCGVLLFAILTLETTGVQHTSAANAGFLITVSVVLVPVYERLGGRRRPPALYAMTLVGLSGCAILAFGGSAVHVRSGDLIILAAALIRAFQIDYSGRHGAGQRMDPIRVTLVSMTVVTVFGLVGALSTGPSIASQSSGLSVVDWLLVGYLGVVGTAYAFGIQLHAVRTTSSTRVAIILSTEPVFAAVFAVLVRHEGLSWSQALGGLLIVTAAFAGRIIEGKGVKG